MNVEALNRLAAIAGETIELEHDGRRNLRREILPDCSSCGREMATRDAVKRGATGYVVHKGRGLCDSCYKRYVRQGLKLPPTARNTPGDNCLRCSIPLMPSKKPLKEGFRHHAGHGLCAVCRYHTNERDREVKKLNSSRYRARVESRLVKCSRCDRRYGSTAIHDKGLVRIGHVANNLCVRCNEHDKKGRK